jgi:hypothetical protein
MGATSCGAGAGSSWQKPIGRWPNNIAVDRSGDLLVLVDAPGNTSTTLARFDALGRPLWSAAVSGSSGNVTTLRSGGILVATGLPGTIPTDPTVRTGGRPRALASVTRLDEAGRVVWETRVGDDAGDLGVYFVGEAPGGDVVIAGAFLFDSAPTFANPPLLEGFFEARLSSSGQLRWIRHLGNPGTARGFVVDGRGRLGALVVTQDAMTIDEVVLSPGGFPSGFLVWLESDGRASESIDVTEPLDATNIGQAFDGLMIDGQGRVYVFGSVGLDRPTFTLELFIAGFDPSGTHLWSQRLNQTGQVTDATAAIDLCGDVLLTGNHNDGEGFLAVRLTRDGVVKAQQTVPTSIGGKANAIGPAPGGMFVVGATGPNFQEGFLARIGL